MQSTDHTAPQTDEGLVDVRGPRFGAALTTIVLATALVIGQPYGPVLVGWQVLVFALASLGGLRLSPYGALFRVVKRQLDLGPPAELEPEAPPRFSQTCGLVFAGAGLVALLLGWELLGWVLVGIVLGLSTLLATTGLCVGCELYLLGARLRARTNGSR